MYERLEKNRSRNLRRTKRDCRFLSKCLEKEENCLRREIATKRN